MSKQLFRNSDSNNSQTPILSENLKKRQSFCTLHCCSQSKELVVINDIIGSGCSQSSIVTPSHGPWNKHLRKTIKSHQPKSVDVNYNYTVDNPKCRYNFWLNLTTICRYAHYGGLLCFKNVITKSYLIFYNNLRSIVFFTPFCSVSC